MSPMTAGIVLSTVALLVQGTRCLIRQGAPPFVRRFGALTLLLAGLSAVLFVLLHFGEAVLSPEFDAVMARGHRRGLASLVLGLAFAAGLGLHVQRLKAERPGRLAVLLALGAGVGLLATMRITTLNPDETEAFRIYAYDLWWPPLLLWVSACFLDGAITILGLNDHRVRVGAFAALLLGLSWSARRRASFGDPTSERLWDWVFWGGVALSVALLVLLVRATPGGARGAWSWLRVGAASSPSRCRAGVATDRDRGLGRRADDGTRARVAGVRAPARSAGDRDDRRDPHRHLLSRPVLARDGPDRSRGRLDLSGRGDGRKPPAGVRGQHAPGGLRRAREPAVPPGNGVVDPARLARPAAPSPSRRGQSPAQLLPASGGSAEACLPAGRGRRALRDPQSRQDTAPAVQGRGGQVERRRGAGGGAAGGHRPGGVRSPGQHSRGPHAGSSA